MAFRSILIKTGIVLVGIIVANRTFPHPLKFNHSENKWRITNVVGLLTSPVAEKVSVYNDCINTVVTIDSSTFLVNSKEKQCLLKTKRQFKVCFDSLITYDAAKFLYSEKFLNVVFEQNKVDSVFLYKSNFVIENDDLGYLRIIKISDIKIIIQYVNYLFVLEKE